MDPLRQTTRIPNPTASSGSTTTTLQTATSASIPPPANDDQPRTLHLLAPSDLSNLNSPTEATNILASHGQASASMTQLPPISSQNTNSGSPTSNTGSQTHTTTALSLNRANSHNTTSAALVPQQVSIAIQALNPTSWSSPAPLADAMAAQHYFINRFVHHREAVAGTLGSASSTALAARQYYSTPVEDRQPLSFLYNSLHQHHQHQQSNQYTRPQFRSKIVCVIDCKHCQKTVCRRGMKAILLADMNVELFSTDAPPFNVQLVFEDYRTRNCACRIRDVACLGCGNVIGYHVTQPCEPCMEACNNGHFWMFHLAEVDFSDRTDMSGEHIMLWAQLPRADRDVEHSGQPSMWEITR